MLLQKSQPNHKKRKKYIKENITDCFKCKQRNSPGAAQLAAFLLAANQCLSCITIYIFSSRIEITNFPRCGMIKVFFKATQKVNLISCFVPWDLILIGN